MSRLVVVEPHADDAYLSLGELIATRALGPVTIVTVFSGTRRRGDDAREYARAVGAEWVGCGLVESGGGVDGGEVETIDSQCIRDALSGAVGDGSTVVWPLGIRHPEHRAIAALADPGDAFYLETPYQLRSANQEEISERLRGREVLYWKRPDWRKKFVHHARFRDQGLFMHRNPPKDMAGAVEVIVR